VADDDEPAELVGGSGVAATASVGADAVGDVDAMRAAAAGFESDGPVLEEWLAALDRLAAQYGNT